MNDCFPTQITKWHRIGSAGTWKWRIPLKALSCEEFEAVESLIDTQYFGIPSAIAILRKACLIHQRELIKFLQNFEFVTIHNKANNPINNCWLGEIRKAFLVDVNVQFSKKVSVTDTYENNSTTISDHVPEDRRIIQIASTSFTFSRFLNDPYLPSEKGRTIYGDITKNAFEKEGRFFVIFRSLEVIAGFLIFSMNQSISTSRIELIAIDQNCRGNGIGQSLIKSMEYHVSQKGIETIQVGTQLNNTDALNFYICMGFRHLESSSIYHYWPCLPEA